MIIIRIIKNGFPSFLSEMSAAIVTLVYNLVFMRMLGDISVSAYSIVNYLHILMLMIFIGVAQATQPIIIYNYGAKEYERVRKSFRLSIFVSSILGVFFFMSGIISDKNMVQLFNKDNIGLIELASNGIKIYFTNYIFMGVNMVIISYFQAIEKAKTAAVLTLFRGLIFSVGGLIILPKIFNINGVWLTAPITEIITIFLSYFLL